MNKRTQNRLLKHFYNAIKQSPIPMTARAVLHFCPKHPVRWFITIEPKPLKRKRT